MANQKLSRVDPSGSFSIARQVMDDAVAFYLANGGPAVAREHVERLANDLKFYDDCTEAYREAMARIVAYEQAEQQEAAERSQQQMKEMLLLMMGDIKGNPSPHEVSVTLCGEDGLPPRLATEKAMLMWRRLQEEGLIDDHYQPVGLSRTKSAVLAEEMMYRLASENERLLGIDDKWIYFERLWHKKNMRADRYRGLNQDSSSKFRDTIQELFADID